MGALTAEALDKLKKEAIANRDQVMYSAIDMAQACASIETEDGVIHKVIWTLKPATKEDVEWTRNLLENRVKVWRS